MFLNPCCARIHRYNPDMKIIAILRNLTDRSYSQWAMEYNRGRETLSFAQALQRKINATAYSNNKQHRVHSYIKRGMYSNQIKRLWNYFGKENVFVARHEDLKEKTQEIVQSICDHIGVKTNHKFDETKQRIGKYPPKNVTEELINLQKIFHHEVTELENLLTGTVTIEVVLQEPKQMDKVPMILNTTK